ncbi:MAG: DUF615 domain-containing protein [Proteobacteria bacterium]|nr:DUF615 domain-containing protein [Pseudomonadota bacterium]NOG61657.1 DUF615 domain-containing protein [Pseudomonadota bacterium]
MEHDYEEEFGKSKSQIKRELNELHMLGKHLVRLPDKQLCQIPVSEKLKEAIVAAKKMKLTALKRQLKFIGGLMQEEDEELIRSTLEELKKPHKQEVNQFHEVEQWRDHLLQGDQDLINDLSEKFKNFERQRVSQLIRNAKKEQTNNKPPKSARLLFKYLTELQSSE